MENQELQKLVKLADSGDATALYHLGEKYILGEDVEKDETKGCLYFLMAAARHNPDACSIVGFMYEFGHIVEIDYQKAIEYYEKGAGPLDHNNYFFLARIYREHFHNEQKAQYYQELYEYYDALEL